MGYHFHTEVMLYKFMLALVPCASLVFSNIISEKSANQVLRSKRGVMGSDIEEDCIEEYCDKEEFFEAAENIFGDECIREGPGGSVYETYYKRCSSGTGSSFNRKICIGVVKGQLSAKCSGGSQQTFYRGNSEEMEEENDDGYSFKIKNKKHKNKKNSWKKSVGKKIISQGKKYYSKKGSKKG